MSPMAYEITSVFIVCLAVGSDKVQGNIKLRVIGLQCGNSPVTGKFPAQGASNAENVSIWWRHHVVPVNGLWPQGFKTFVARTVATIYTEQILEMLVAL